MIDELFAKAICQKQVIHSGEKISTWGRMSFRCSFFWTSHYQSINILLSRLQSVYTDFSKAKLTQVKKIYSESDGIDASIFPKY